MPIKVSSEESGITFTVPLPASVKINFAFHPAPAIAAVGRVISKLES